MYLENQVAQLKPQFQLCANEDVCLVTRRITDSSRSVGQPAPRVPDVEPRSVEQPADQDITLTSATPLWDNLIGELEPAVQNNSSGAGFINYITKCCFQGDLLHVDPYGEFTPTPVSLSFKMEELLRAAVNQRGLHRQRPTKDTRGETSQSTCV